MAVRGAILVAVLSVAMAQPTTADVSCPVTIPNRSQVPPGGGSLAPGGPMWTHGNGLLWTILPGDGVWVVPDNGMRPGGTIEQKFVWWRRPDYVTDADGFTTQTFAGELRISGRRLDEGAPPLTATTHPDGVHVGSLITFPTGGCWEITGTAGADSLTFTVYMLPPGWPLPDTALAPPAAPLAPVGILTLVIAGLVAVLQMCSRSLRPPLGRTNH